MENTEATSKASPGFSKGRFQRAKAVSIPKSQESKPATPKKSRFGWGGQPKSTHSQTKDSNSDTTKPNSSPQKKSAFGWGKTQPKRAEPAPQGNRSNTTKKNTSLTGKPKRLNWNGKSTPKTPSLPSAPRKVAKTTPPRVLKVPSQDLHQKLERLELLMDVSRQFSATLDFNKLMQTIFDKVLDVLDAEAGSFWIPDSRTQEIVCSIAEGPAKKQVMGLRLKSGTGIVGWVMQNKQKTVIFDASKDARFSKQVDQKTQFVTKSMLCVPLVVKNECVGAIQVLNKKSASGQFSQDDLEMLENLSNSGAIAIKNARLYQSEQRIKELNTLLNISKELTSTLDLDRVMLSVVNLGSQVIHYKRAVIGLLDTSENVVLAAESNQAQPEQTAPENVRLKAIMDYVIASGSSLYVNNYRKDHPPKGVPEMVLEYMEAQNLRCLSVIILADSEGKLGLLSMEGAYSTLVAAQSNYVISMMVNQATVAIRNAQLYQNIPSSGIAERFRGGLQLNRQLLRKVAMVGMAGFFLLLAALVLPVPSNVVADVEIVPEHRTQVTVIENGVVQEVLFGEGDLVQEGQVLLRLDPALLELEKAKLTHDHQIASSDLRFFESQGTPYEVALKRLEIQKLENQLTQVAVNLNHMEVTATSAGRILTANPEELIDKQVTTGEVIAEIAVADRKSSHLIIDESDVLILNPGDQAQLTLQALPGTVMQGELTAISQKKKEPESEDAPEGYIGYVLSQDLNEVPSVKFGMTGRAKIHTGQKTLYQLYIEPALARLITQVKLILFN